jgi:serine/threonine protein kinase
MIGQTLGGYRLEHELGGGVFGTVYQACHVDTGWVRAVKVAREQRFGEMLREEDTLLGRLAHPHVVQIHHMDTTSTPPYLVVEYIKG